MRGSFDDMTAREMTEGLSVLHALQTLDADLSSLADDAAVAVPC